MESVGSPEEEVKLNIPVPAPHIFPHYFSYFSLFLQVSNPYPMNTKNNVSGEGEGEKRRKNI